MQVSEEIFLVGCENFYRLFMKALTESSLPPLWYTIVLRMSDCHPRGPKVKGLTATASRPACRECSPYTPWRLIPLWLNDEWFEDLVNYLVQACCSIEKSVL